MGKFVWDVVLLNRKHAIMNKQQLVLVFFLIVQFFTSLVFAALLKKPPLEDWLDELPQIQFAKTQSKFRYPGVTGDLIHELFQQQGHEDLQRSLDLTNIKRLLAQGADVNVTNEAGLTLFMAVIVTDRIADSKKEAILREMLNFNVNLNLCSNDGKSVFWLAAERELIDVMHFLKNAGAPTNCFYEKKSIVEYAQAEKLEKTLAYLRQQGFALFEKSQDSLDALDLLGAVQVETESEKTGASPVFQTGVHSFGRVCSFEGSEGGS